MGEDKASAQVVSVEKGACLKQRGLGVWVAISTLEKPGQGLALTVLKLTLRPLGGYRFGTEGTNADWTGLQWPPGDLGSVSGTSME